MELGNLMLMCMNLVCVTGAGFVVLWAVMHIQQRQQRRYMRIYDRPPLADSPATLEAAREEAHESEAQ